jgi:hypothetical protein
VRRFGGRLCARRCQSVHPVPPGRSVLFPVAGIPARGRVARCPPGLGMVVVVFMAHFRFPRVKVKTSASRRRLQSGGGLIERVFSVMTSYQHHAYRESVDHATGDRHGRVTGDVLRAVLPIISKRARCIR